MQVVETNRVLIYSPHAKYRMMEDLHLVTKLERPLQF
jgi:hypothetical protein